MRPITLLTLTTLLGAAPVRGAEPVDFARQVRPILAEACYACHGPDEGNRKAKLRLDTREGAFADGVIVPGKAAESDLIDRLTTDDPTRKMPPPKTGKRLTPTQIALLRTWIDQGARWEDHWAFVPPRRTAPPRVRNTAWPRGDIDRYVLAPLEARGLKPAADADRVTLIRRAYFDLIGLPPTPDQIDAFVQDPSPEAFARVVDELLASPHFGERWGRHWLDVARFSETSGGGRSLMFKDAWRYRDYVIAAFQNDVPYDRFLTEQIAGDLLPHATPEQRTRQVVATGFLALGPTNYERQDKDVLEMDVVDEQLDTIGRGLMGLTVGCARCHDHKFDPIPTREYYALAGIFTSTQTLIHDNVSRWVDQPLPVNAELAEATRKHEAAVAALKEKIRLTRDAERKAGKLVAADVGDTVPGVLASARLPGLVLDDAQAKKVGPWRTSRYSGTYIGEGYLYDDRSTQGEKTLTFVPEFTKGGRYEVRLAYVAHSNRAEKVAVTVFAADGERVVHVNQREAPPVEGRFVSLGTYRFEPGTQWFVLVSTAGAKGHVVADAVQFLPVEVEKQPEPKKADPAVAAAPGSLPAVDSKTLEAELKKLVDAAPPRPLAMSVQETKVGDTAIRLRGVTANHGPKVPRGFLHIATRGTPPAVSAKESGRRELAGWLTRRDNPLTARVMANRVWHHLFGAGLVRTVDEFGTTGEAPSHPELLDHLALDFTDHGWSVKHLIRTLVLSRTYQLSSDGTTPGDPENRLLAHANRRRLTAEALRDAILQVSGTLDRTAGGPTVKPGTTSEYGYQFDDTRRSVYVPVFRNRLPELFEAFDFADPNLVMGRRNVSTVATQALFLMNSPFTQEQARHAARAALARDGDDADRLTDAYRTALGRAPTAAERRLALDYLRDKTTPDRRETAWARVYQVLFACIDFRYVN